MNIYMRYNVHTYTHAYIHTFMHTDIYTGRGGDDAMIIHDDDDDDDDDEVISSHIYIYTYTQRRNYGHQDRGDDCMNSYTHLYLTESSALISSLSRHRMTSSIFPFFAAS